MLALETRGVDAIGVDLVPLRELSIVADLVALLEALHHLGDRTAWLAVLRAPWCGLSLETLTAIFESPKTRNSPGRRWRTPSGSPTARPKRFDA